MALPFSHDHPPRSAHLHHHSCCHHHPLPRHLLLMVVWPTGRHTSEDAIIRLPAPPRHQGLVEVGITDSPHSCHSRDQLYRQIRQSPIPPPGINLEKTHRAAFSFFVKCCEALWVSPISGWNQLCVVFHCPPPLYLERVLFYMVCECWKDNICFLCHLARAALRNSPRDKYFQSKHE